MPTAALQDVPSFVVPWLKHHAPRVEHLIPAGDDGPVPQSGEAHDLCDGLADLIRTRLAISTLALDILALCLHDCI